MKNIRIIKTKNVGPLFGQRCLDLGVGGGDLGFPCYDEKEHSLHLFFGDSFAKPNFMEHLENNAWRSQVEGIVHDYKPGDQLIIDDFFGEEHGSKRSLVDSHHKDKLDMTKIPTGCIFVHGSLYFSYFNMISWTLPQDKCLSFGGVAKKVGDHYERVASLTWGNPRADETLVKRLISEDESLNEVFSLDYQKHLFYGFQQVYFKDYGDEYIYCYGEGGFRGPELFLARVKKDSFEDFESYEYYAAIADGFPAFMGMDKARDHLFPILSGSPGEFTIVNFHDLQTKAIFYCDAASHDCYYRLFEDPWGPFGDPVKLISKDEPVNFGTGMDQTRTVVSKTCSAYAPMTCDEMYDPSSKSLDLILSRFLPIYIPYVYKLEVIEQ